MISEADAAYLKNRVLEAVSLANESYADRQLGERLIVPIAPPLVADDLSGDIWPRREGLSLVLQKHSNGFVFTGVVNESVRLPTGDLNVAEYNI